MRQLISFALMAALLTACNAEPGATKTTNTARGGATGFIPAPTEDNIGDLEQAVMISVSVAERSKGPNIEATSLVDATGRMNLFTVDITPPLPQGLWLDIKVESRRAFPKNPGVLRIAIKDGDQVLDSFGSVIGSSAQPSETGRSVNVLAGRAGLPDTMLITLAVEALLMPEGTDPDTIDPRTAEVSEDRYSRAVAVPPIRINTKDAAAPLPPAPAAAEGTDSETDAPAEDTAADSNVS